MLTRPTTRLLFLGALLLTTPAVADVSLDTPAFDPKLEGASLGVTSSRAGSGGYSATLVVRDAQGALVRTLVDRAQRRGGATYQDSWDGRDGAGRFVAPGGYSVALAGGGSASVQVVRLGLVEIDFAGSGRVPLTYHRPDRGVSGNPLPLDALGAAYTLPESNLAARCLDRSDGSPLELPALWSDTAAPPRARSGAVVRRGRSLHVAYAGGAAPRVRVRLGGSAAHGGREVSCNYPQRGLPLRIVLGQRASSAISPGDVVELESFPLGHEAGRWLLRLEFTFQAQVGGAWVTLPGRVRTSHPLFVTMGQVPDGSPAWVGALDLALGWAQGQVDPDSVADELVRGVNAMGLVYDVNEGAPAYTDAPGGNLAYPIVDLGAFLDGLDNGRQVNCLDCASLVNALAHACGVESDVLILGWNFRLHYLQGIGFQDFTHSLFGGYHSFSYHAVATRDQARTVHDACLNIDGDARPDRAPFSPVQVTGIPTNAYLQHLSADAHARPQELGQVTVR
jgi:FlgD Ig-like domain